MSTIVRSGLPCPCGMSSDAYAVYEDGTGYCFSGNCSQPYFKREGEGLDDVTIQSAELLDSDVVEYVFKAARGISKKTMEVYDIRTKVVNGEEVSWGFQYPDGAWKSKAMNPKSRKDKYVWSKTPQAGLFGRDKFPAGSRESVCITEGEFDCPSVYEALGGSVASCSVQSSSSAVRDIEADRDYLNSFKKIILAFDQDEAGKNALKKVMAAGLFDFNKLYYIPWTAHKDANAYLQADDYSGLVRDFKAAKKYTPDNIISTFSEIESALKEAREDEIGTYPTDRLNDALYGLHRGQVIIVKGMEGIGKTELFRMMEHHLLKTTDCKLAMIHMEEDKSTTIKGVATYELGVPCALPDSPVTEGDILSGYRKAVGDREDRVFIYTMFGGDDPDDVLDSMRFLVSSGSVDIVFLDHITMLVSGQEEGDERRKLDYLSTKLKKMCKELHFCLVMITHVNDDGQTRGSRMISKIADTVISLNRDKESEDEVDRNSLFMTVEKNRMAGRTGPMGQLFFNASTYKLEEV